MSSFCRSLCQMILPEAASRQYRSPPRAIGVQSIAVDRGRGAGSAGVQVVDQLALVSLGPELFTGLGFKAEDGFFPISVPDGEHSPFSDGNRAVADADFSLPQ